MRFFFAVVSLLALCQSCEAKGKEQLIVFHAGSLSVPLREMRQEYAARHPELELLLEAAGSRDSARKISELNRRCDVFASADHLVIDQLLIPEHAAWNVKFASNEMALVYTERSRRRAELSADNWFSILLEPDVSYGRSDPDADPCGYRSIFALELAERHYGVPGLAEKLLAKDRQFIRPKETDLLGLLESHSLDYVFLYRSVAEQHRLKYLLLPAAVNLGDPAWSERYAEVSVKLRGRRPGEFLTQRGEPMLYGVTIPTNAPNPAAAVEFLEYLLDRDGGGRVLARLGQPSVVPAPCTGWGSLPSALRRFALRGD
jgi:molybdate/tungstate transport system substrate-binding protein